MRNSFFTFKSSTVAGSTELALALLLVSGAGCLPRGTDETDLYAPPPPAYSRVNFSTLSTAVLAPHCLQCHAEFGSESGVLAYVTPGDPEGSLLYTDIASRQMPPGGPALPAASLLIVGTYIDDLVSLTAPEPAASPSPTPSSSPTPTVNFATLSTQVLTPLCLQCHAGFNTAAGIASYIVAGDPNHSSLYEDAKSGAMPPGGPAVSTEGLTTIYDYIEGLPSSE